MFYKANAIRSVNSSMKAKGYKSWKARGSKLRDQRSDSQRIRKSKKLGPKSKSRSFKLTKLEL